MAENPNSLLTDQINRALGFDFDVEKENYERRLQEFSPPPDRYNFFDLATDISRGLTAQQQTDRPNSLAGGLALGFNQASQSIEQKNVELAKARREIGLQAARLAMESEDKATEFLNKASLELSKRDPDNELITYLVTSETPIVHLGQTYNAGASISLSKREANAYQGKVIPTGGGGVKSTQAGTQAFYMTEEDAKRTIRNLGLRDEFPSFDDAVKRLVPLDAEGNLIEDKIGKEIYLGGQFLEMIPQVTGEVVSNIMFGPIEGVVPFFTDYRKDYLKNLAKTSSAYTDKIVSVVPRVDNALAVIMSGAETGIIEETTLPIKQALQSLFKTSDPNITFLEDLQAISFFLGPKMRPVGSGSTSDMEFKAYQSAVLSLGKGTKANYLSLYAFKKLTENSVALNALEKKLYTDGNITSIDEIDRQIAEFDKGIFTKVPDAIQKENFETEEEYDSALNEWYRSLPNGEVVDNSDGIWRDADGSYSPFLIKGWETRGRN